MVPNERLVFSWAWHSTPERESQVTVSLKPDGGGTLLTLHHEQFFDEAARDGHEKGWIALLDKLEAFVKPELPDPGAAHATAHASSRAKNGSPRAKPISRMRRN